MNLKHIIGFFLFPTFLLGQFTNVTEQSGIDHSHAQAAFMGGGAVFFDFNNDGWEDLYVTGGVLADRLYQNDTNGHFIDVSDLIPSNGNYPNTTTSGVIAADLDRDGWKDLVITTFSKSTPTIILKNQGGDFFLSVPSSRGFSGQGPSMGAAFTDLNKDGLLDIYVINYIDSLSFIEEDGITVGVMHDCASDYIFLNQGDFTFSDVSSELNNVSEGCGLAVTSAQFLDQEGIYIANDFGEDIIPNQLLSTKDEGLYVDDAPMLGLDAEVFGMGIAIGDYDKDLDLDLYVTSIGSNVLLRNNDGIFTDVAEIAGVADRFAVGDSLETTGWGTIFFDYDNDKDLDLAVANGYIPSNYLPTSEVDPSRLFQNVNGRFNDVSEFNSFDFEGKNRGIIYSDYDNDGDLDVLMCTVRLGGGNEDGIFKYQLFRNDYDLGNNFLQVDLQGTTNVAEGYGTKVVLYSPEDTQLQYLYSGGTHASQNSDVIHFGLKEENSVDSILVYWPNGIVDAYRNPPVNQKLLLEENNRSYGILGCIDNTALNFNPMATINSGCRYDESTGTIDLPRAKPFARVQNPVFQTLRIEELSKEVRIMRIIDMNGKVVFNHEIDRYTGSKLDLDVDHLSKGAYLLQLYSLDKKFQSLKFIKL